MGSDKGSDTDRFATASSGNNSHRRAGKVTEIGRFHTLGRARGCSIRQFPNFEF